MPNFTAEPLYRTSHFMDRKGLEVRPIVVGLSLWTFSISDDTLSQTSVHRTTWMLLDRGPRGHVFQCDVTGRTRKVHPGAVDGIRARLMNCSHSFSYDAMGLISYVLSITEMAEPSEAASWLRDELPGLFGEMSRSVTANRLREVDEMMSL